MPLEGSVRQFPLSTILFAEKSILTVLVVGSSVLLLTVRTYLFQTYSLEFFLPYLIEDNGEVKQMVRAIEWRIIRLLKQVNQYLFLGIVEGDATGVR